MNEILSVLFLALWLARQVLSVYLLSLLSLSSAASVTFTLSDAVVDPGLSARPWGPGRSGHSRCSSSPLPALGFWVPTPSRPSLLLLFPVTAHRGSASGPRPPPPLTPVTATAMLSPVAHAAPPAPPAPHLRPAVYAPPPRGRPHPRALCFHQWPSCLSPWQPVPSGVRPQTVQASFIPFFLARSMSVRSGSPVVPAFKTCPESDHFSRLPLQPRV